MKNTNQRILAVLLVLLLGVQLVYGGMSGRKPKVEISEEQPLLIWYTAPDMQTYIEGAAADFSEKYAVEVKTELVTEVDYIETISQKSMAEEMTGPDLYVSSSALLEKATLAGMTVPVKEEGLAETYSEKAINAVTYNDQVVAWPFYIETSFLIYNRAYVEEVPETIEDILIYAENFESGEGTEKVEKIFEWNVADVIEDYLFMGAYTNLGGPNGDDKSQVTIELDKVSECMKYYQSLNGFFAIDADTITSDMVVQNFVDGKTVFAIMNVPMLAQVDQVVDAEYYGVSTLPELNAELESQGVSVTTSVVVNPYSLDRPAAEELAKYLTESCAGRLYEESGKLPACTDLPGSMADQYLTVYQAYEESDELPKLMELFNLWLELETVMADIWRGADPQEKLTEFANMLARQLD